MSLTMTFDRTHCIPGSCRGLSVRYASDREHGEKYTVESLIGTLRGVSKSRVSTMPTTQDGCPQQRRAEHEEASSEITFLEMVEDANYEGRLLDEVSCVMLNFRFPEDPVLREHYPARPPFDDVKVQALPPSGTYGGVDGGNSIEYYFETRLVVTDGKDDGKRMVRTIRKTLDITPTREPEAMHVPLATITKRVELLSSMDAAAVAAGPTMTTRQPQTVMMLDLEYPQAVAQREPFTLHLVPKTVQPSPPDGFINSWTVQLVATTRASVPDDGDDENSTRKEESWTTEHLLGSEVDINDFEDVRPSLTASPTKKVPLQDLTVPATCAVSFATPNLQRTYRLRVIVMLQCGGSGGGGRQLQELRFDTDNVTVLGAELGERGREREYDENYDEDDLGPREFFQGRLLPSAYVRMFKHVLV